MGTVLFMTWNGGGNVNPVVSLSEALVRRGHRPHVLGSAALESRFTDRGIEYTARDPGREWNARAMAEDVIVAANDSAADAIVVDYMLAGGLCGAEATGRPTAALVHTLYGALIDDGELDPMYMAASVESINEVRARSALDPVPSLGTLLQRSRRVLVTCPKGLDVPVEPLPSNVRYIGPAIARPDPSEHWVPPTGSDSPLVSVSLGTTPMDEEAVLERVLAGLAALPVRVVATVGDHVDVTSVVAPSNATVEAYVTHSLMLPHVDVMVTHAGLGTVLNALAHGVPMVCIPLGREQPQNADAVVRVGAGVRVEPDAAAGEIADAVRRVLADPSFADAARRMAAVIAMGVADDVAMHEIESLMPGPSSLDHGRGDGGQS